MSYNAHPQRGTLRSGRAPDASFTRSVFDEFASPLDALSVQARHQGHAKARKHQRQPPVTTHTIRHHRLRLPPGIEEQPF